ncbi:roadblock/LC7 domain-containing protein [Streptomyces sp. NA02950]|uniref:roadblock/LC7 domain-containing protein n=1 Tax=Streptomyces sp. NA02950 TaxID=2742137 RepID=UPI00158FC5B4|nr:roadblock/LC7 domain-containing protein [Streptomyces sp. NA02950]QKV96871.1 roadblock/LC7 domain-containing protein [Streptomyces sp. NA02950]
MTKHRGADARSLTDLDRVLDDLVDRGRGVRHVVILSGDGTTVSASRGLSRPDAEHLAAVASGFHSLARSAGRRSRAGRARPTVIETAAGHLCVAATGDGGCLAVLGAAGAAPAAVVAETARLVERMDAFPHGRRGSWPRRRFGRPPPGYPDGAAENHGEGTRRCER